MDCSKNPQVNEFMGDFFAGKQDGNSATIPSKNREPKEGDRAYSKYHGIEEEGILKQRKNLRDGLFELIVKGRSPWLNPNRDGTPNHLSVGYDEPIRWDAKRNMWYAPADYD